MAQITRLRIGTVFGRLYGSFADKIAVFFLTRTIRLRGSGGTVNLRGSGSADAVKLIGAG